MHRGDKLGPALPTDPPCHPLPLHPHPRSNGVNLNRDFPGPLRDRPGVMAPPSGREQPETAAVMAWTLSRQFTAGANLHEGAFVVNYPWDNSPTGRDDYTATQDDGVFRYLASGYAARNPQLWASQEFQESHGITNGADWYTISGGERERAAGVDAAERTEGQRHAVANGAAPGPSAGRTSPPFLPPTHCCRPPGLELRPGGQL